MKLRHLFPVRAVFMACALASTVVFSGNIARADTTEWMESEGGRMRIVSLPADETGRIEGVLQIDLKPGWITYWREPGEAGIPPQLKPDEQSGVSVTSLAFPVPKLIKNDDIIDIGYDASVDLPFMLQGTPGSEADDINLTSFVGVCLNICIPFEANFSFRKDAGKVATSAETDIVQAAKARLPEQTSDDFKVQNFHITPDKTLLGVELHLPEDAPKEADIFIAGPSGYAYFEPQNLVRDKRKLTFYMNIKGLPKTYNPKGQSWTILVKSGERAMETTLDFPAQ